MLPKCFLSSFVQFLLAVVPMNATLGDHIRKGETTGARELRSLPKRQESPRVEGGGELLTYALLGLGLGDAKAPGDRLWDLKGNVHWARPGQ